MADLIVNEKYPNSWRIDHPDFGDVLKTPYAKGVIADVQKDGNDPITAKALVKVTGDFGESNWIPLFFHPKAKYWDPDSQKYNEGSNSFEKAWMSFRGDDEVAVMLKEGTPVAAMGFADGVPRIGEDIVRLEISPFVWWQMSQAKKYPSGDTGPDGLPLKLALEAEMIIDQTDVDNPVDHVILSQSRTATLNTVIADTIIIYEENPFYQRVGITKTYTMDTHTVWTTQRLISNHRCQAHLIKVGPILYLITGAFYKYHTVDEDDSVTIAPYPGWSPVCAIYDFNVFPYGYGMPPALPFHFNNCDGDDGHITADAEAHVAEENVTWPPGTPFDLSLYKIVPIGLKVYAAIYSDKLYKTIKDNPPVYDFSTSTLIPSPATFGFTEQPVFSSIEDEPKVNSEDGMKLYSRPHTKAELQAAGMWPANKGE